MPFAYYGAKHGLAKKYPRPRYDTIIEPFAGAAGYSCHWAHLGHDVILNDAYQIVTDLWARLQQMTPEDLAEVEREAYEADRTSDPLIAWAAGTRPINGQDHKVTPRMRGDWHKTRNRVSRVLPVLRSWRIVNGDYRDLPDIEATWFIDPPYQQIDTPAGSLYAHGSDCIDYAELGEWCRSRRGQVIVCEQSPAAWLPFTPIARQQNGDTTGQTRTEVVWLSDQQQLSLL